jgi:predicted secreted protein
MYDGQHYSLKLDQRPARTKECDSYSFTGTKIFSLILTPVKPTGKPVTLQADKAIPKNRNCPLAYSVAHVYRAGSMIVVFIRYTSGPGFEGNNISYLAVGGKLP